MSGVIDKASSYVEGLPTWGKAAVAGGVALAVYIPYKWYTNLPRKTPWKDDWKPGMVYLYQLPRFKSIPSLSAACLKLETFLRMASIDYEIVNAPCIQSKEGTLPFVELNGKEYYDSGFAIRDLTHTLNKENLEEHLSPEQKAVSRAIECLAEKSLRNSHNVYRLENINKLAKLIAPNAFGLFTPIISLFFMQNYNHQTWQSLQFSSLGVHSREDKIATGVEDLRAISNYLGTKHYLTGFKPTRVDATLFGVLAQIVYAPYESEHLNAIKNDFPNIMEYVERIKSRYWPDWGVVTSKFVTDSNWKKKPRTDRGSPLSTASPMSPASSISPSVNGSLNKH